MNCKLVSSTKGYEIVCEFLRMTTFNVYFHAQNGSQRQVANCLLFDELQCFNDPGFVYEKTDSSAAYITIPRTFEWTPGTFVCQTEESSAENITPCVWPPKNSEVPESTAIEEASLTSADHILTTAGIVSAFGVVLSLGLLVFLCLKKRSQTLETIARIKKLVRRVCSNFCNKQNSRKGDTTTHVCKTEDSNTEDCAIPLRCGESKASPTNEPYPKESGDTEILRDDISGSVTVVEIGEIG